MTLQRSSVDSRAEESTGVTTYRGMGMMKWCAMCGCHRVTGDGRVAFVLGGRHWVCGRHPKATNAKS